MVDRVYVRAAVSGRVQENPLGPYLEELAAGLREQEYAPSSIQSYLRAGAKFGRWLERQGCDVAAGAGIDDAVLTDYVSGLARYRSGKRPKAAEGLTHLFRHLRNRGVVGQPQTRLVTPVDQWLTRYDDYLEHVVGATISTRERYRPILRRFVSACCGAPECSWRNVTAPAVSEFVGREAALRQGHGRRVPSVAVRSFLRFLVFQGEIRPGLEAAAPTPPQWLHAALPVRLTSAEVAQVLATYQDGTARSLRNRAMLLLLARLGLRAGEVTGLRLDDIDWRHGRVFIQPGKTHQERCLPLPHDVGGALAAYLRDGRPRSASRQIFLRCQRPLSPLATNSAVRAVVEHALRRAGIRKRPRIGSHLFRHTVASQMLNRGASFKDVADVLGHRSLQTTGIYAKLELDALAAVALPWMGGAR